MAIISSNVPHGGLDLLAEEDRKKPDDPTGVNEKKNLRSADPLDMVLSKLLGKHPGPRIDEKTFYIPVPNSTYVEDVTFDRFYVEQDLFVDFFAKADDDVARNEQAVELERRRAFVKTHSEKEHKTFKYLPVFGGIVEGAELARVVGTGDRTVVFS